MFNYLSVFGHKDRILSHFHHFCVGSTRGALLDDRAQPDAEGDRAEESGEKTLALDLGLLGLGSFRALTINLTKPKSSAQLAYLPNLISKLEYSPWKTLEVGFFLIF